MIKIIALTSIRSDYDLMSYLYRLLHQDSQTELKLVVSGAHLSASYGLSVDLIKKDSIPILIQIESLIDSDSKSSRIKTASIFMQSAIEAIAQYDPDVMIYAGDREDIIAGALIAGYLGIPTIHFYGGDHVPDGNIDNPVRHAVSKLSNIHFVAHQQHAERLIKMGEDPKSIFNIGSVALDKFNAHKGLTKLELFTKLNVTAGFDPYALVIFHPLLAEEDISFQHFENILRTLLDFEINAFISYPNTDAGNKKIISVIHRYEQNEHFFIYKNLPRDLFLSLFKNAAFIIGNSSAGILEAASIPIPAINVGQRQTGRFADENVVYCKTEIQDISDALRMIRSPDFQKKLKTVSNSYGQGDSSQKALKLIKQLNFKDYLYKRWDPLHV